MFILGNLISAMAWIVDWALAFLEILVIARVILFWVHADPYNTIVRGVPTITEPLLRPFRRLVPPWRIGGLDLSPLFAILALHFIRIFLTPTLYQLAEKLK